MGCFKIAKSQFIGQSALSSKTGVMAPRCAHTISRSCCMVNAEGKPHDHLPNWHLNQTNPIPSNPRFLSHLHCTHISPTLQSFIL